MLGIDPAMETQIRTEISHEISETHVCCSGLDRVKYVQPIFDEPGNDPTNRTAGMLHDSAPVVMREVVETFERSADELIPHLWRDEQAALHAEIIPEIGDVDHPVRRIEKCPLKLKRHSTRLCPLHRRLDDALASLEEAFRQTTLADIITESTDGAICSDRLVT